MNKMKKLLSVVLAVVLAFSAFSVLGSAAKTAYKTVDELKALDAYSPYGQVTRLTTEERASIVLDYLDSMLPSLNVNMGEVFNVLGLSITLDLTSVDRLCYSLDTVAKTLDNWLAGIAMMIVNLGVLEQLNMDTWAQGYTRAGAQLTLFAELFELLSNNTTLVNSVLTNGLDLGIVGGLIGGGLDLTSVNAIVKDLPAMVKGLIFGLFERWDDTTAEIQTLEDAKVGNGKVETTVNTFVQNLFKNDMSISTVKADANGNTTSKHNLPGAGAGVRVRYTVDGKVLTATTYATKEYVDAQAKLGKTVKVGDYYVSAKYVLEPEVGTSDYIWHQVNIDEDGNMKTLDDGSYDYVGGETPNLKYYELDSQLLPGFDANIDLTTMSAGDLLYTFIPYVFEDMAPVVLNGSVKKILAEFFGAKFTYVGDVGSDAVKALPDFGSNAIFTEEQGDYMFEWSDYAVVNGNHYYRYLDQIFAGDISNKNNYFDIVNWDYEITADFMNEFIPANDDNADVRLLKNVNNFLIKVATTVFKASANTADSASDYTATWTMPAFVEGGNENLVNNLKMAAQAVISLAPQHIFGSDYETNERCYYDLMMSTENNTVLAGLAAHLVNMIMPTMSLPGVSALEESEATVGSILAAVVREFAAYLIPEYNFDALIYADFGTTTADPDKTFVSGKDNNYWLDVILTMGINIGFEYIRAFADMGEGTAEWDAFVEYSKYKVDGGKYEAMTGDELRAHWEGMLDYVVDWALSTEKEWTWKMANLVEVDGLTIDLTTAQDPWGKLDKILFGIIPFDEILTIETTTEYPTKLEKFLRYDLILGLVELRWGDLINTIQFNGTNNYFRTGNVMDQLAKLVKNIVNGLLDKIGGGDYKLIPDAVTDFDSLANQANIRTLAVNLVGKLKTAYDRGLLDTVLPILNMFLGWKTADPQVMADPVIWTSFNGGNDYALQSGVNAGGAIDANNTLIKFQNNSSGMLETHRESSVVDHAYEINILEVKADATTNNLTFTYDKTVSPWETVDIKIGGTYNGEEATTITIKYEYVGKDGQPVGGTQYKAITVLFSNQVEDASIDGRKEKDDKEEYTGINQYKRYQFTEDIYSTFMNTNAEIFWAPETSGNPDSVRFQYYSPYGGASGSCDNWSVDWNKGTQITGTAAQYFAYDQTADWPAEIKEGVTVVNNLYTAKAGVTADTEFPYGVYDGGHVSVKYGKAEKEYEIEFIYFNSFGLFDIYAENVDNGYHANMGVDPAIYEAYNNAWKWIVFGATYPMMTEANGHASTDFVKTIQPYIPQAIADFEAAKEAFEKALAEVDATASSESDLPESVQKLEAQLKLDVTDEEKGTKEVNFQDYEFYEYFAYADLRTSHRNFVKTYYAPEIMDTYYIMGSGIREAELNKVIAAEDNAFVAAGIEASKLENDPALVAESIAAHDNWEMPVNSDLLIDDMTARLKYYRSFLDNAAIKEAADHKYFLDQEIAHVKAQGLVAEDYEAVTWGRFADALAEAEAVSAGDDAYASYNSRIYDVKYNLMVAYKQLLPLENSLIKAGGTADLLANINTANEIFASLEAGDGAWALKEGVDADEAYAALIQALGYYYEGEDGITYNLYADSALEYADNDRPNNSGNQAKVNAANTALVAAIENFVAAEPEEPAEPNTLVLRDEFVDTGIIVDLEIAGFIASEDWYSHLMEAEDATATGMIYGLDTVGYDDLFESEYYTQLEDAFTTAYGDEYLEIITPELAEGYETTGTIVNVLDKEGNVVETYYFIYFGDVNGDGYVDSNDGTEVFTFDFTQDSILTVAATIAADYNGDSYMDANDGTELFNVDFYQENYPLQADLAAAFYAAAYGL